MSADKSFTVENLNRLNLQWRKLRTTLRFGQYWMNKTGFVLPKDFIDGYNLWEEKDAQKAYRVIFQYLMSIQS